MKETEENRILELLKDHYSEEDFNKINDTYLYICEVYEDRMVNEIETYTLHNLKVCEELLKFNVDVTTIVASFLHGILNSSKVTIEEIKDKFGDEVARIVESINAINNLSLTSDEEKKAIYLRKVLVGLASDVRVIFIKLADRLHNMKEVWPNIEHDYTLKVNETEKVLIPIAHRLGMDKVKSELEDLCLKYTDPISYQYVLEKLELSYEELNDLLKQMEYSISYLLKLYGIEHEIKSRVKSISSIDAKLKKGKKFSSIYDILALRVFVNEKDECYRVIGLIHSKFSPISGRFKDYIANPKANMYQSLHTTVKGFKNLNYEVQVRTYEMDLVAEKGAANHWSYKEKNNQKDQALMEQKLEFFRNLIENSDETGLNETINNEILADNIYVFTPKKDVVELPVGSTPIDFAFRIHSKVGETIQNAIVNDEIVPLDYQLKDNDVVRINTNPNASPSKDWLNIVKTTQAKNKIKAYFNQQDKEAYISRGKELIEKELKKRHLKYNEVFTKENLESVLNTLKINDEDELYLLVGSLRFTANYIIGLLVDKKDSTYDILLNKISSRTNIKKNNYNADIIVDGVPNIKINIAKCCNPIYGDDIKGYITMGDGVTVHRSDCTNILQSDRLINVEWVNTNKEYYTNLFIETTKTNNYLLDTIAVLTQNNVVVDKIVNQEYQDYNNIYITIRIHDKETLDHLIVALSNKPYITRVNRGMK